LFLILFDEKTLKASFKTHRWWYYTASILLAILAASVFLTSCEQSDIEMIKNTTLDQPRESDKLILPFGVNQNEDLAIQYLNNATQVQIDTWENNAEIAGRLASIDKLDEVNAALTFGQNISEFDLNLILSNDEMEKFNQASPQLDMRGCWWKCYNNAWSQLQCCKPPYGDCWYPGDFKLGC